MHPIQTCASLPTTRVAGDTMAFLLTMDTICSSGHYSKQKSMKEQNVDDRKPWEVPIYGATVLCSYLMPMCKYV